jgi:hypothetical protein
MGNERQAAPALGARGDVGGTLPPKADVAVGWDRDLHELRLSSRVMKAAIAVADDAAAVRSYPEMFGLAVVIGVVPFAPDGKYRVE